MQGLSTDRNGTRSRAPSRLAIALALSVLAAASFGFRLSAEPLFPDETAYVSQAYFYDLLRQGRTDDWAWVEYHAYDLPPLPKYLFGLALDLSGQDRSNRLVAGRWFQNIRRNLLPRRMIDSARWASVLLGGLGCGVMFLLGASAWNDRVGVLAALLLAIDPLYRIHSRRAMSEASVESLVLLAELAALLVLARGLVPTGRLLRLVAVALAVGLLGGLAVLAKLSGFVALLVIAGWTMLLVARDRRGPALVRAAAWLGLVGLAAVATFIALNPYTRSHPRGTPPLAMLAPVPAEQSIITRLAQVIEHRAGVSREAQSQFPNDALRTPLDKIAAVLAQGFGRFGPFGPQDHDSLRPMARVEPRRDWSALIWGPLVMAGLIACLREGSWQAALGLFPIGWALVLLWMISVGTVTAFIPLAWDRYFLPIQSASILVGAIGIESLVQRLVQTVRGVRMP